MIRVRSLTKRYGKKVGQSTSSQQSQMLQVTLNPAPVSFGEVENIAWHFFVALFESDVEVHFPASAS